MAAFTARSVAALPLPSPEKKQADHWDSGAGAQRGLGLRISFGGTKTWLVRYRANGQRRRLKLGEFPAMWLADARTAAHDALHSVQVLKLDPAASQEADTSAGPI